MSTAADERRFDAPAGTRIDVRDCAKTYPGGTIALRPTTMCVEPGEVLALLGPSGCGKTTLLRVIAGLVDPDPGGQVLFNQDDVTAHPVESRGIGMVFQHYALFPQMSVEANIGYGLRVRGVAPDRIRERVGELVELVRLNGLERRRPGELSGGQRQRVALARAVAVRPRVLLLDEPLTALDAKLKEVLRAELAQLLRQLGITAIHVTHDQQEAMAVADRLAVMCAGRIVQSGRGEDLYRRPAHPFVAEFLGRVNRLARPAHARAAGVVTLGGAALACPDGWRDDEAVLVRPEDVEVRTSAEEVTGETGWGHARVTRRLFLGDRVQLRLHVEDQEPILADRPRDCPIGEGATVRVRIDPSHLMQASSRVDDVRAGAAPSGATSSCSPPDGATR